VTLSKFYDILYIEMKIEELKNKKILILGFGREGMDSFIFLRKIFPQKTLGVGDRLTFENLQKKAKELLENDNKVKLHLGENYLKSVKKYQIIIKSPGIPFYLKELKEAKKQGKVVTSQTELFFQNCPGKIIGVTGTKGKSTTVSLIYKILKTAKKSAYLVGNIGKPALSFLLSATEDDIYVYELSSHQLANIKQSPHIAVFLNVYPEHLDYYRTFKEYIRAKANITKFQTKNDYLIFNGKDKIVKEIAKKTKARKFNFTLIKLEKIIKKKEIPLRGDFNLLNIKAAVAVGRILKIPDKTISEAIKNFKPLLHRLEYVGEYRGIKFFNDSLSTIPQTTIAAIDALGKNTETIILGGFDRGLNFSNLAKKILKTNIKTVILFPTSGKRIWSAIEKEAANKKLKKLPKSFLVNNMREAVKIAYRCTHKGKICLLSCASPSFGLFKDYRERGRLFKKYVKKLGYEKKPS